MKSAKVFGLSALVLITAASMAATTMAPTSPVKHPHFRKAVSVTMGEQEMKLSYVTMPANMEHVEKIEAGDFVPGRASLEFSQDQEIGESTIPAGSYTICAIKNGDEDWTLALYPGRPARGEEPDASKAIKLESMFVTDQGDSGHVHYDLMPGHGDMEGKLVLIWSFGKLHLAGALS
ncbi:MAG: hypothetical protein ACYTG5_15300 [Planctomycetota bacterium]|jgi:hypothetical protein